MFSYGLNAVSTCTKLGNVSCVHFHIRHLREGQVMGSVLIDGLILRVPARHQHVLSRTGSMSLAEHEREMAWRLWVSCQIGGLPAAPHLLITALHNSNGVKDSLMSKRVKFSSFGRHISHASVYSVWT